VLGQNHEDAQLVACPGACFNRRIDILSVAASQAHRDGPHKHGQSAPPTSPATRAVQLTRRCLSYVVCLGSILPPQACRWSLPAPSGMCCGTRLTPRA
jgi:hypothetical protein